MFRRRSDDDHASTAAAATDTSLFARPVRNSIRPPVFTRQQHIDSYLKDNQLAPSTRKVSQDDSTYDTVFQSVAGDTLILRVHWPAAFSSRPPAMTLAGVEARHGWLDGRMRITGYPPIQSEAAWRESKLLLGTAVLDVIKHLQLQPPQIVQFVDAGLIAIQTKKPPEHRRHRQQHSTDDSPPPAYDAMQLSSSAPPIPNIDLPTIPKSFPELDGLTRDELEELTTDELAFKAFCNRLPVLSEYRDAQFLIAAENAATARQNLKLEPELKRLHAAAAALRQRLSEKLAAFRRLEQQQDAICQPPDVRAVCRDLNRAKREAFDESERLAEEWLRQQEECAGGMDEFCRNFLEIRKIHHERAAKLELLERNNYNNKR